MAWKGFPRAVAIVFSFRPLNNGSEHGRSNEQPIGPAVPGGFVVSGPQIGISRSARRSLSQ